MSGIGGGAFYLFCFEELRRELLGQCSSKTFVEDGTYQHERGWGVEGERGVVQVRGRPLPSR